MTDDKNKVVKQVIGTEWDTAVLGEWPGTQLRELSRLLAESKKQEKRDPELRPEQTLRTGE